MRNRVRRRFRELYRLHKGDMLPGYDIIMVARVRAADFTVTLASIVSSFSCCTQHLLSALSLRTSAHTGAAIRSSFFRETGFPRQAARFWLAVLLFQRNRIPTPVTSVTGSE